ncbi:MAG: glycosyltransferase family 2 protein [Bacteroidota bacterium]
MQLSVIILNYNVRYFLEQCVLSVQKALEGIDGEIIVVDNNSSDDSCSMMKKRFPNVQLIQNLENVGFPKGNNIGVAQAKGEYICILNPDTVVAEDTFEKVLSFAMTKTDLGIVGCKLIDGTGHFLPESKRGVPTPWVSFTKIFGLYKALPKSKLFNQYYAQHLNENKTGKVAILVGAFMVMKRELYNEIGGFDENCFMYSDDIDLSYMVLQKGKSNYYFHETTVIHYKGESTVKDGTYMKRFQQAMNFFYKKHFNPSLFFAFFMQIGAIFFSLVKRIQGKPKVKRAPEYYILVSDSDSIKEKVETKLQKKVQLASLINGKLNVSIKDNSEIIIDTNTISFKEAIRFLEENKSNSLTFKLLPITSDFIIGSNSSYDRGEVITLIDEAARTAIY